MRDSACVFTALHCSRRRAEQKRGKENPHHLSIMLDKDVVTPEINGTRCEVQSNRTGFRHNLDVFGGATSAKAN